MTKIIFSSFIVKLSIYSEYFAYGLLVYISSEYILSVNARKQKIYPI